VTAGDAGVAGNPGADASLEQAVEAAELSDFEHSLAFEGFPSPGSSGSP
jgi:hypothetical protein